LTATIRLRSPVMVLWFIAAVGNTGCTRRTPSTFFPDSNEVVGWTRPDDIRTFEAADLWKYIDGEAERYLKTGVQRVSTADYKFQTKVDATADVFTMSNAEGAGKILQSEPGGDAKQIKLGDEARLYSQSLEFRKGRYLVRIVAYQESAEVPLAIEQLGRGIEARLR